jgi:hypothetical protein
VAITTQDQLIAAMAAGRTVQFNKVLAASTVGAWLTTFRSAGMPGAATAPATAAGAALSRTSVGAMPIPAPVNTSYISSYEGVANLPMTLVLADRLVETGALSSIVTTAQTVASAALPARASAATDVELWLEIHTALGATASATVTASYTNQAGTAGRTATLVGGFPASPIAGRCFQMSLQAGDTGVQSVQSVTTTTSSGTAGAFGVTLRRTLLSGPVVAQNLGFFQGYAETDLQICPDDACLELLVAANTGTANGVILGNFGLSQG